MTAEKLVTPQEAAKAYGTTVRYIYKMASLHGWRKIRLGRTVHYHWDDVGNSLGK